MIFSRILSEINAAMRIVARHCTPTYFLETWKYGITRKHRETQEQSNTNECSRKHFSETQAGSKTMQNIVSNEYPVECPRPDQNTTANHRGHQTQTLPRRISYQQSGELSRINLGKSKLFCFTQ